jgi:hypothetical protein
MADSDNKVSIHMEDMEDKDEGYFTLKASAQVAEKAWEKLYYRKYKQYTPDLEAQFLKDVQARTIGNELSFSAVARQPSPPANATHIMDEASLSDFVTNLALATTITGVDGAAVDGGSVVSFVGMVDGSMREDVLNSTLLAQLAANKKWDKLKKSEDWYKEYVGVLEHLGWVAQAFNFSEYNSTQTEVNISKVVLELLAALVTENELAFVTTVTTALQDEKNAQALKLFQDQGSDGANGNCYLSTVVPDKSDAVMSTVCTYFSTEEKSQKVWFFWTYKSETMHLFTSSQKMVLNHTFYATIRDVVIKKLGDKAKSFIADLDI